MPPPPPQTYRPAVVTQQLAAGITPAQAYRWLSQWSTSAPKFLVPPGAQHASSGQVQGNGFLPGAVFETTYTEQKNSLSNSRSTHMSNHRMRTVVTKWTFTVLDANQMQGMVRFSVDRQNVTDVAINIGPSGRLETTSLFQFSTGTSGATVLSLTTSVHVNTNIAPSKKPGPPCLCYFPLCWCCLFCWCCCNPVNKLGAMATDPASVEAGMQKNTTETVRLIHFALQAAQQDGSINGGMGMQQQQQQLRSAEPVKVVHAVPVHVASMEMTR